MRSFHWTSITLYYYYCYGLVLWGGGSCCTNRRPSNYYQVHASIDPSSSFSNHHCSSSCSSSSSSSSSKDFLYSQTYQLNFFTPPLVSFPVNTSNLKSDKSVHLSNGSSSSTSRNINNKPSFDTWIQKFNSRFETLNRIDLMNDERDDTDDTDEDDQDSDDGHSSMLSSISIYRKHQQSPSSLSAFTTTLIRSDGGTTWNRRGTKRHIKVGRTTPSLSSSLACRESIFRVGRGGSTGDTGHHDASRNNHHLPAWITQWFVFAVQSRVGRSLIVVALVTLVFEALIGHILEFLKIVMQTNSGDDMTYLQVIRTITAEKGILGLWDGFCPWGIVQAVCKGAVFGVAHATALQILKPLAEQKYIPMALALTLAGGVGGGFQGYILSPTLLLKTRVMTNPVFREKMSAWSTTLLSFTIGFDVVKKEGIGALMKGANVFATKRVFDWASRYYFADLFEDLFVQLRNGSSLSVAERSAASLLGGIFSTMVTLPLDVLVAKTQDAKKAGIAVSPLKLFQDELREKGWNGVRNAYMRGFEARLLHVCLTTVVIKTGTPIAYDAIFGRN